MYILNFFFPQKIKFPDSKFNKNISILQYQNSAILSVDGLVESGDILIQIWKKAIRVLLPKSFKPKQVLLLGLAGGCNARLINRYFPKCQITAVEIDPFMIELGKKFFKLGKIKNTKIIIDDAVHFIDGLKNEESFDLILVDCFIGKIIPKKLEELSFLKNLKKHSRFVLINRLRWQEEKTKTVTFFKSISPYFFFIKTHTRSNVIISLV